TPIDMSELNPDVAKKNTPLDQWLQKNFLDPYNSEVIYRNHMYYHESDRNVSPPNVDAVKPMMTSVLEGFVKPYDDVAGVDFMKKNMPRQWVLRSEEHTSELQSRFDLVCRLLLEKKNKLTMVSVMIEG